MRLLIILFLFFSLDSLSCEDQEKPKLSIQLDSLKQTNRECSFYLFSVPTNYKEAHLTRVILRIRNELAVTLSTFIDEDKDLKTSEVCLNDEWLKNATFAIEYKESAKSNGAVSMCAQHYEYTDLSSFVVEN